MHVEEDVAVSLAVSADFGLVSTADPAIIVAEPAAPISVVGRHLTHSGPSGWCFRGGLPCSSGGRCYYWIKEMILTDVSDTIHAESLALFALNIEILLTDVTKPEKSNILTLT